MEKFDEALESAKKRLLAADHMINVTFNMMHDPKVLMSALKNLNYAVIDSMNCILYLEEYYKEIDLLEDSFIKRFEIFSNETANKFKIDKEFLDLIEILYNYNIKHEDSPVVFSKEDSLVICDENYNTDKIDITLAKKLVAQSKSFINLADTLLRGQDVFYRRSKK